MTNKYILSLLEIINVTSMEMDFLVRFAFLESKKEDSLTWALEVCRTMLKDQDNMKKIILTNRDTTLMSLVTKVVPT